MNFNFSFNHYLIYGFLLVALLIPTKSFSTNIDSLKKVVQLQPQDSSKAANLIMLSSLYRQLDISLCISYANQALELSQRNGYRYFEARAYSRLGAASTMKGDTDLAIDYTKKALKIAEQIQNNREIATCLNNLGVSYKTKGEIETSLHYFQASLKMDEQQGGDLGDILNTINNITSLHLDMNNVDIAYSYLQRAMAIGEEQERLKFHLPYTYIMAGRYYMSRREPETSLSYLKKGYQIAMETGQRKPAIALLTRIGIYQRDLGRIEEAIHSLKKAQKMNKELGGKTLDLHKIQLTIAELMVDLSQYDEALLKGKESLQLATQNGMEESKFNSYQFLTKLYEKQGNYKRALFFHQAASTQKDSLQRLNKDKVILELESKYQIGKKELENELLRAQQKNIQSELRSKNTELKLIRQKEAFQARQKYIFIGILGLLALLTASLIYAYLQMSKKKQYLEDDLKKQKIIKQQSNKLIALENQKAKLVTNIAHELQTPLSIIQGYSQQILKKDENTPATKDALSTIIRNSNYLSSAVTKILETSSKDDTIGITKKVLFDLDELIQYILQDFQILLDEKDIKLALPSIEEQVTIYADVDKVETILKNLISNAIKYTPNGKTITINYSVNKNNFHQIEVADTGSGIAEEELPNIFDRFYQAGNKAEGGFGIGLSICKEMITSLGGLISVSSTLGAGSTFTIQVPRNEQEAFNKEQALYIFPKNSIVLQKKLASDDLAHSTNIKNTILIVEDNLDFCKYLEAILKDDFDLFFTHNGEQAISYLENNMPTLVLTDWMMPQQDGLGLVEYLKTSPQYCHLPVLMLTARVLISDKLKALRVGIDDYLVKPVEEEVLINRINQLLTFSEEKNSAFSTFSPESHQGLSGEDQQWLINLEQIIFPLIEDFNLNLNKIADLIELDTTTVNRRMKAITGFTTKRYIQEIRYWEARRLLETGTYESIKMVCLSVGFKDIKYFSRKFKERFGKYPSEYLNKVPTTSSDSLSIKK